MQVLALSQEDSLEEKMPTHCSILAWKILWTEGYSPWSTADRVAYTTDIDLSHFWRLKSEIEVLVDSVSDEHIPPGLQMATFPKSACA